MIKFTVIGAETMSPYWIYTSFQETADDVRKNLQCQERSGVIINFEEEPWNPKTDPIFSNKLIKPSEHANVPS